MALNGQRSVKEQKQRSRERDGGHLAKELLPAAPICARGVGWGWGKRPEEGSGG